MRSALATLSVAVALVAAAPASAAVPSGNLLRDPGAEEGELAVNTTAVSPPPAPWITGRAASFTQVAYGSPGFPASPGGGGNGFFAGGPQAAATESAVQLVDVSGAAAEIDAGRVTATLAALLGGYADQDDDARVTATFASALAPLGSVVVGPSRRRTATTRRRSSLARGAPRCPPAPGRSPCASTRRWRPVRTTMATRTT